MGEAETLDSHSGCGCAGGWEWPPAGAPAVDSAPCSPLSLPATAAGVRAGRQRPVWAPTVLAEDTQTTQEENDVLWKLLEAPLGQSLHSCSPHGRSASRRTGMPHTWAVCQGSMFPPGPLPPARRPHRVLMTPVGQFTWRQDTYLPRPVSTGHKLLT